MAEPNKKIAQEALIALEDNLESIYDVELDSGNYFVFVKGDFYQHNVLDKLLNPGDFFVDLIHNIDAVIHPDDRAGLSKALTRGSLRKALSEKDRLEHYYRILVNESPVWFKVRVAYKDKSRKNVIVGVFNAEEEVAAMRQKELEAAKKESFFNTFVKEYEAVFVWNLSDGTYYTLSNKDKTDNQITGIIFFVDALKLYIKKYVHPEDSAQFSELIHGISTAKILLSETQPVFFEYRSKTSGDYRWRRISFNRVNEADVLVGMNDRDEEITARIVRDRLMSEYDALYLANLDKSEIQAVRKSRITKIGVFEGKLDYRKTVIQFADIVSPKYRQNWIDFSNPDYMKAYLENDDHREFTYELPATRKAMRRFTADVLERVNGQASVVLLSFVGIDDITARTIQMKEQIADQQEELKKAYNKLRAEVQRNDTLYTISNSSKWSYEINSEDQVVSADYADRLLQNFLSDRKTTPMSWLEFLHPEDKSRVEAEFFNAIRDHSRNTPYDTMFRAIEKDGSYHWIKSSGRLLRHEDGSAELFGMSIDITSQIEEKDRQQKQLADALSQAQSANRAKTAFLNSMSHDIRTPMNAIIGFNQMALREFGKNDQKVKDCLEKVRSSSETLLNIINDILKISRIEAGKITISEEKADAAYSFANVEPIMRQLSEDAGINLQFSYGNMEDRYVLCDIAHSNRVFINLIGNAIKYSVAGGTIKVRCEQTGRSEDNEYAIYQYTFEDNGIGMSKEFQKELFKPFSREQSSTVSQIQGTGLGLAMSKSLIDMMGGTITCQSEKGKGTKFTVTLPFKIQDGMDFVNPSHIADRVDFDFTGKRILLVEDNALNREIATAILAEYGIESIPAENGDIAVEKMRTAKADDYDLILMDVQMPTIDGYEATRRIRALGTEISTIPIIAMTANAFEEDRKVAIEAGMDDHIAKPVDIDKLKATLAKYL